MLLDRVGLTNRKIAEEMGEKAWEALGVEEKGVITVSFYTTL